MGAKNRRAVGYPIDSLKLVVEQGRRAEEAERNGLPPELQRPTKNPRPSE